VRVWVCVSTLAASREWNRPSTTTNGAFAWMRWPFEWSRRLATTAAGCRMSVVRTIDDESPSQFAHGALPLTTRQRLALVIGGKLTAQEALSAKDEDVNYEFFVKHAMTSETLTSVGIGPTQLKQRGATHPSQLRTLGFGTLDLCDAAFCADAVAAFGADELVAEFLVTPSDALVLAGSSAVEQLGLDVGTLLCVCEADFDFAFQVLLQSKPRGKCLVGVAPLTLLESGLRKSQLVALGYNKASVAEQTRASEEELTELGF